jgi:hypothetical protein
MDVNINNPSKIRQFMLVAIEVGLSKFGNNTIRLLPRRPATIESHTIRNVV